MENNKRKKLVIGVIVGVLVLILGGTFALWAYSKVTSNQLLVAGDIYLKYTQNTDNLNITNAMPSDTYNETDKLEFTIEGKNTYKKDVWYEIVISHGTESGERHTRLEDKYLKFRLTETKGDSDEEVVVEEGSYEDFSTGKSIWVNTIAANTKDQINIKYKLYVWISNETLIGNTEDAIPMEEWNDTFASIKVTVNGDFEEKIPDGDGEDAGVELSSYGGYVGLNGKASFKVTSVQEGTFTVKSDNQAIADASIEPSQGTQATIAIEGKQEGRTNIKVTYKPTDKEYKSETLIYQVTISKDVAITKIKSTLGQEGGIIGVTEDNTKVTEEAENIREYRYSGLGVKNYVKFNNELWRIIGIFKDESGEEHMKIVRDEVLPASAMPDTYVANGKTFKIRYSSSSATAYWDYDGSAYDNNWADAGLMNWLNSKGTEDGYLKTLTSEAQGMIEETKYYLGSLTFDSTNYMKDTVAEAYKYERAVEGCTDNKGPSANSSNSAVTGNSNCRVWANNALTWNGNIALMYPSDYGYTVDSSYWTNTMISSKGFTSTVVETSWLFKEANHLYHEWFLSPSSYSVGIVANWNTMGNVAHDNANVYIGVRPSLNLKSSVSIIDGNGEKGTPYELGIYNVTELELDKEIGYTTPNSSITFKVTSNNEGTFEVVSKSPKIASASIETNSDKEATITIKGLQEGNARIIVNFKPKDSKYNESSISYSVIVENPDAVSANIRKNLTAENSINDGETTYLSGDNDTINFNYVWYSGKLWRITAINSDNTIKMITQNSITVIHWGTDTKYKDKDSQKESWIYQWLNEDFLDTLENKENIIVQNAKWNIAEDGNSIPVKPVEKEETTVNGNIGLLNAYEYYQSYKNLVSYGNGYLNINCVWWLITPYNSDKLVRIVDSRGQLTSNPISSSYYGVRPSVNLKSNIKILGGDGTKEKPYRIERDKKVAQVNDKLNSRLSGEYVNFDGKKYRIVGIENEITKLTSADYLRNADGTVMTENFGSNGSWATSVSSDSDDKYWSYYLNNTWYNNISETYRNMLVQGTYYLGKYPSNVSYKNTICSESNTTKTTKECNKTSSIYEGYVGLPRLGEMFSAQLGNEASSLRDMWLITPYDARNVWFVSYYDSSNNTSPSTAAYSPSMFAVRPSITLNSNVVITEGEGTEQKPYEIKCDTCNP